MDRVRERISYPQLVLALGVFPMAVTTFLPEPFGTAVPATAWGILSGVSWYIGRNLAAVGWFLFLLLTTSFLSTLEWVNGTLAVVGFFGFLACAFGLVVADAYYNDHHKERTAT